MPAVSGPQERVPRCTVEQIDDSVPVVPLLHTFLPQVVVQLVEVLRPCDTVVPEQVIEAPKITSHEVIPQRNSSPCVADGRTAGGSVKSSLFAAGDDDSGAVQRRCRPLAVSGRGTDGGLLVEVGAVHKYWPPWGLGWLTSL